RRPIRLTHAAARRLERREGGVIGVRGAAGELGDEVQEVGRNRAAVNRRPDLIGGSPRARVQRLVVGLRRALAVDVHLAAVVRRAGAAVDVPGLVGVLLLVEV